MKCKHCGEQDESRLILSSRLVNGKTETIDICLACFWIDKFKREDGNALSEGCERAGKRIESARDIDTLSLQK